MRPTREKRKQLVAAVMEFQEHQKPLRRIIEFLVNEHGCSEWQANNLVKEANVFWAQACASDPGKGRVVEALGRIARKAEQTGKYSAAVKAHEVMAKVLGLNSPQKIEVVDADDPDRKRLEQLLIKYEGAK